MKLKRAVRFDYLDFSTPERRRLLCEAEVRLNRRTAPTLYRGVVAVTRESNGSYALGGSGTAVDWVVEMTRFPQDALFDRLASRRTPSHSITWARWRRRSPPFTRPPSLVRIMAAQPGMSWVIGGNADGFAEFGKSLSGSLDGVSGDG